MIPRLPKSIVKKFIKGFANPDLGDFISMFDNAIENQGYSIEYQEHMICPCVSLNTVSGFTIEGGIGSPNPVCPQCKGYGKLYVNSQYAKALVYSITQNIREFTDGGKVEIGTVMITPKSEIKLNYFDRFRLIDEEMVVNELFKNTPDNVYILNHNPLTIKKIYMYIPNLNNPQNSTISELVYPGDYTIDLENAKITLTLASYPQNYNLSILYLGNPWFYIINLAHHARGRRVKLHRPEEQWLSLPRTGMAKRGDLIKI